MLGPYRVSGSQDECYAIPPNRKSETFRNGQRLAEWVRMPVAPATQQE